MLKILQARLQQYMNRKLPDVQAGFRKGRGTRDHLGASLGAGGLGRAEETWPPSPPPQGGAVGTCPFVIELNPQV